MTHDEKWNIRYQEVRAFVESNKRNVSKYDMEERDMYNWLKATRKKMNAGTLGEPRLARFRELLALCERYRRKNQYE